MKNRDLSFDYRRFALYLFSQKWLILTYIVIIFCASIFIALKIPDQYTATAKLVVVKDESQSAASIPSQFTGLAGLAGIQLSTTDIKKLKESLVSHTFLSAFIKEYELGPYLLAVEGWDSNSNELKWNNKIFLEKSGKWVRQVSHPYSQIPEDWELVKLFRERISATVDSNTDVLVIALNYYSPRVGEIWLTNLLKMFNDNRRQKDILEAENSIQYLRKSAERENSKQLQLFSYSLIEQKLKTLMLANVREEYIFEFLDKPHASNIKTAPKRAAICIALSLFSFVVMLGVYFLIFYARENNLIERVRKELNSK